jgi:very-short-patch-repair endonuclease
LFAAKDFWLLKWRGQHSESAADATRDQRLNADGYRVLRFWNNDVLANLEGVLTVIQSELLS